MSNYPAIATVTAPLQNVLRTVIHAQPLWSGVDGSTARPDTLDSDVKTARVNIFLYQTTPNAALRNADLPTRRVDGQLVQRPQVALDLHYLLSFYGDEKTIEPQRL